MTSKDLNASTLPDTYEAWQLYGAGIENVGKDAKPESLTLRPPNENEIVLRVDAVGLCQSDIKIIKQGGDHPRLRGRNLAVEPTVLGHECAATVAAVGDRWKDRFQPGERYIIQADIYYHGIGYAFGYVIPGGLAQYCYLDERALEGDEGCYLLPVKSETGYSQAALTEPWACVEMAYQLDDRVAPQGGRMVIVDSEGGDELVAAFPYAETAADIDSIAPGSPCSDIVLRAPSATSAQAASDKLARGGVLYLLGQPVENTTVSLDIGRIHYEDIRVYGGADSVEDLAEIHRRKDLLEGGAALFLGAGGPMGQMHVQRALERANGPAIVVVTDLDRGRLDHIQRRFAELLERRPVKLVTIAPSDFSDASDADRAIRDAAPNGYNDIVVMAPVPKLVAECCAYAAPGALLNVFAGVPIGQRADIPLDALCNGLRIIGSSGSRIQDMRRVLAEVEAGRLDTNLSVAAIGGLEAARDGLVGLAEARYPGKTVIYPHVRDLPLTPLDQLASVRPEVFERLGQDHAWTIEAERALLETADDRQSASTVTSS